MSIINNRKIFYIIAVLLVGGSLVALATWGLRPGLDFTGGSLLNVSFDQLPPVEEVSAKLTELGFNNASVRQAGADSYIIRLEEINQDQKNHVVTALQASEKEFSTIGPVLGQEAIRKSYLSITLVLLAIILFITFAFRKVSLPAGRQANRGLSSWVYGAVALIALAHDVIIPTGVFAWLGHYSGVEVDTLFVTALLVILGFSVHDTIVVFDRVRENLRNNEERGKKEEFDSVVGRSIKETLVRSINTSVTTLLAILALYIWGPESTRFFALAMAIGIVAGTYSSIFIGSPLLVTINSWKSKSR